MKKVSKIILVCMLITVTLSTIFLLNRDQEIYKEERKENKFLTLMVEKEAGSGKYEESSSTFPQEGYYLNQQLSKCENGSKIKYNEKDKTVDVYTTKADKCYVYFDYDKLGSICRGENMAECFTKNYKKDSTIIYHDGNPDYEGEENYKLETGDLSYRYSGGNDVVNNYVCLVGISNEKKCTSDEDLYRIIGLFKNSESNYEMKLIKAQGATTIELGDNKVEGGAYFDLYSLSWSSYQSYYKGTNWETLASYNWNTSNVSDSSSTNTNMCQYSNLNKENLNKYFYNYITTRAPYLTGHIVYHVWNTGGMSTPGDAKTTYELELGANKVKIGDNSCYAQGNASTKIPCTKDDLEYTDHIGLIYVSDYMYGTLPEYWTTTSPNYSNTNVKNSNWVYVGMYEWTFSRDSSSGGATRYVGSLGNANYGSSVSSGTLGVRPVFYISSDFKLKSGSGSKTNPYRIEI